MSILTGDRFLAYLPAPGIPAHHSSLSAFADYATECGLEVLTRRPYILAVQGRGAIQWTEDPEGLFVDVFPGTAAAGRDLGLNVSESSWPEWHSRLEKQAQFYNLIYWSPRSFRLEGDLLAIKPVYSLALPTGMLLSTRISDLIMLKTGELGSLDQAALYGLLNLAVLPGDRTLHKNIRRLNAGTSVEWNAVSGTRMSRNRRISPPSPDAGKLTDAFIAGLRDRLDKFIKERMEGAKTGLTIGLSGGYDSRIIAAAVKKAGYLPRAVTYGKPEHHEVWVARLVAKKMGLQHDVLPSIENVLMEKRDEHVRLFEGQVGIGCSQIMNAMQPGIAAGTPFLHGILAGQLSGDHIGQWMSGLTELTIPAMVARIMQSGQNPELIPNIPVNGILEMHAQAQQCIRDDMPPGYPGHQAFLVWDLENRQRRLIGAHIQVLGQSYDVVAPFYDLQMMTEFLTAPCSALDRRDLYRNFMRAHIPELAKIPHSQQEHPVIPNLRYQALFYARSLIRNQIPRKIMGARLFNKWRKPDIEYLWSGLRDWQKQAMFTEVEEQAGLLESLLGIELHLDKQKYFNSPNSAVRNLYMLAGYSRYLNEKLSKRGQAAERFENSLTQSVPEVLTV